MPRIEQRQKAIRYKYEAEWNEADGWHFSFGDRKLWETKIGYMVADLIYEEHINLHTCDSNGDSYRDHEEFDNLADALEYMRTNKRP